MAQAAQVRVPDESRHPTLVRVTHWLTALSVFALLLSGFAILLAHPRMYWGETGWRGAPSLFDLPLPFVLDVPIRGPGRYLHFLAAWVCVLTGVVYVVAGALTSHFRRELFPERKDLAWGRLSRVLADHFHLRRPTEEQAASYNVLQRGTYLGVVFVLFPLILWTGLAMSPAVTSVFPFLVNVFGGQQSARTIHFFLAVSVVLFVLVHVLMVYLAGFRRRVRAMVLGHSERRKERV